MKIRFYQNLNGYRWTGFILAIVGVYILSNANIATQWVGWLLSTVSCGMWVYFGYKDRDMPRTLMELMYLILSLRAIYNWIII